MGNEQTEMMEFINQIDSEYHNKLHALDLFNPDLTKQWDADVKKQFAGQLYHIRGYFIHFMWYLANFNSNKTFKQIILDNIGEEVGINEKLSHEQLYAQFAEDCGVDVQDEILHQTNYSDFARTYNHQHIEWLSAHSETAQIAAFAAYERLDNIDYVYLYRLGQSLNLPAKALLFFKIHTHVEHFGPVLPILETKWVEHAEEIKMGFEFIYSHQYNMWANFSNALIPEAQAA